MTPLPDLTISTLAKLYATGSLQPEELVHHICDKIEGERQPIWIHLVPREDLLRWARDLKSKARGPLYGIPFAIKDNIDVAGVPTTAGCPSFSYVPCQTAFVVQRLLDAGCILVGKTNMDQFATGLVGTRSPFGACSSVFDSRYISGGSSSGSAVAVAAGLVSFALGTDTAGSGRVPAAFNNIVGLKPSRGLLSARGVVPACRSLDCVSIFANNSQDAKEVFLQARAFDELDPYSRQWPTTHRPSPLRLRCGVPRDSDLEFFGDKQSEELYRKTVAALLRLDVEIEEVDLAPFRQTAGLLYAGPYVAERFTAVGEFVKSHKDAVDPVVGSIIEKSERYSAAELFAAEYQLRSLARQTSKYWGEIDFLVLPTTPTIYTIADVKANPVGLNSNLGIYTNFVNLLDLSAVSVPAGLRPDGLPFGVSLIGPTFAENSLLSLASRLQPACNDFAGLRTAIFTPDKESAQFANASAPTGWVKLAVVGAHLGGQPLNFQLRERGSVLLETTSTAGDYKLYALTNTNPAKPGLVRVPGFQGAGIEVEVWQMPECEFGSFVSAIPPPLCIGSCQLASGEVVKGFVCEPYGVQGMPEITEFGGWREYLRSKLA